MFEKSGNSSQRLSHLWISSNCYVYNVLENISTKVRTIVCVTPIKLTCIVLSLFFVCALVTHIFLFIFMGGIDMLWIFIAMRFGSLQVNSRCATYGRKEYNDTLSVSSRLAVNTLSQN